MALLVAVFAAHTSGAPPCTRPPFAVIRPKAKSFDPVTRALWAGRTDSFPPDVSSLMEPGGPGEGPGPLVPVHEAAIMNTAAAATNRIRLRGERRIGAQAYPVDLEL